VWSSPLPDWLAEIDEVDPLVRSSQGVPLVTLGQVLLPQFGVIAQALVIPVESPQEFLSLQGIDGRVYDIDDGDLTSLGQRLEPLRIWTADSDSCGFCCHETQRRLNVDCGSNCADDDYGPFTLCPWDDRSRHGAATRFDYLCQRGTRPGRRW
jgi:hypothetical protein